MKYIIYTIKISRLPVFINYFQKFSSFFWLVLLKYSILNCSIEPFNDKWYAFINILHQYIYKGYPESIICSVDVHLRLLSVSLSTESTLKKSWYMIFMVRNNVKIIKSRYYLIINHFYSTLNDVSKWSIGYMYVFSYKYIVWHHKCNAA